MGYVAYTVQTVPADYCLQGCVHSDSAEERCVAGGKLRVIP